ncbi:uncharacterized protein LOC101854718 [Aplysia californica]|uniref:Uncharacterized protein LOC101854718 n=1 Tax=Aplysia californica TaxID=6500 RepID=A0ABM0JQ35_APLCA|nr:uncharacterized protein LOC101854718 [Aplysia californica]XP_005098912.1 uncharacterized protein LOC101854718 [Aplysia californica]
MAFNNAGPSMSGRYHRSMPFMQQMDFSGMAVSAYPDLSSLMDIAGSSQQCSTSGFQSQVRGMPASGSLVDCNRTRPLDFNLNNRSLQPEFPPMSSIPSFPGSGHVQRGGGPFAQQFHSSYSNHTRFPETSYHYPAPKNTPGWCTNSLSKSHCSDQDSPPLPTEKTTKAQLGKKSNSRSKKDKKPKFKRVRYIKPGCSVVCRRRCKEKISQSLREDIFNEYWNLESDSKKKEFIANNAIKMPMMKCKEGSRRSFSVDWAFSLKGESYSVCKLFFLHTLDIPENTAYAAIKESAFFTNDTPIIDTKETKNPLKLKPTWFETDLDDYSSPQKKGNSKKIREASFSKKEKYMEMRAGCTSCRRNCQSKFTREERLAIFNEYRSLSNIRKQRDYIAKYIIRTERKRIRPGLTTRRGCSIEWSLPLKEENILVCKTFFLHTVGISERSAYNIGLQNEIKPVVRTVKNPRKTCKTVITSKKAKTASSIMAKGKLKSALRLSRKKVEKIESNCSETEIETDVGEEDYYSDAWKENKKKKGKTVRKRKKRSSDKTVRFKKAKLKNVQSSDSEDNSYIVRQKRNLRSKIRLAPSLFNLPIKKRENHIHPAVPVLKIKKERIIPVELSAKKKKRNPYKRKETPTQISYPLCPDDCPKKCRKNLSEDICKEIFNSFWSLKNMEEQRQFISTCVRKEARATCSCLIASKLREKRRGYKIHWNLDFRGLEIPVCKTFFMHVLQISDSVVYRAIRNDKQFEARGPPLPCKHFTGQFQTQGSHSDASKDVTRSGNLAEELNVQKQTENKPAESSEVNDTEILIRAFSPNSTQVNKSTPGVQTAGEENCSEYQHSQEVTFESCAQQTAQAISTETRQKNHQAESSVGNTLCQIEANYESLIPSLHEEEASSVDQVIPSISLPMPSQSAFPQFCHSLQVTDTMQQPPQGSLHVGNPTELWPSKPLDSSSHPLPSHHNMSVFPALTDYRMDAAVGNCVPGTSREFSHFFPMDSRHQIRMGSQNHFSNPTSAFSYHPAATDIPTTSMNQAMPISFGSEMMGFFHSQRFHALNVPMPRECTSSMKPQNAPFSFIEGSSRMNSSSSESLVLQSLSNTNNGIPSSVPVNGAKSKKRKKKSVSIPKSKVPKVRNSKSTKRREKKPFTKSVKPGCADACKRKCGAKIPWDARETLFKDFWNLENDTKRREFILPIVKKVPKKSCSGVNSRRCCTIEWGVPYAGERQLVCKRFFLDTFDIGEKFVKTIFDKMEKLGGSMQDMRGRHCKRSYVFMQEQDAVESHVRSVATLKAIQCIQCKKDFTRWCTEPGLSMAHFYKTYAEKRKLEGGKPACRASFTDICTKKFNIKMSMLKEDMCDQCTSLLPPVPEEASSTISLQ